MSVYATAWAREAQTGSPMAKCLLFALAEFSNNAGTCYPSHRTLARVTEMSPGSVKTHLGRMADAGLIEIKTQLRPDGSNTSNTYRLIGYAHSSHYQRMLQNNAALDDGAAPYDETDAGQDVTGVGQELPGGGSTPIPRGGTTPDPQEPPIRTAYRTGTTTARAREEFSGSHAVEKAAGIVAEVRGLERVDPVDIAQHLDGVLTTLGRAVEDEDLIAEAMRFREYWNQHRASHPRGQAWRRQDWHRAVTNWFTRMGSRSSQPRAHGTRPAPPRGTTVDRSLANLARVMAAMGSGPDDGGDR